MVIFGNKIGGAVVVWFLLQLCARAAIITNAWVPAFKGVDYTTGQADANEVRMHKVFAFRVDLHEPTVEFFSTPSNGATIRETDGQTTTTFVNTFKVAVGLNANFFSPVSTTPNEPRDLNGLAISRGNIVSDFASDRPAVLITRSNVVTFRTTAPTSTNYWTAVAGSDRVLINGVAQKAECTTSFCLDNPRSAVGLSSNGRYFYMMVIDGRRAGWSDGATLYETGQWLARLGAWNGLNLDGGGSTALAREQNGTAVLMNKPSGGVQRVNGNHLGVFAQPLPPTIVSQPQSRNMGIGQSTTFNVTATGGAPLRYQWQFNGVNLNSATNSAYTASNLQLPHFGYYSVVVTNGGGKATSSNATLVCTNQPTRPSIQPQLLSSNGTVSLKVNAAQGRLYSVQTSSNLVNWVTVTNVLNQQSSFQWIDPTPALPRNRYYRIRWAAP